MEITKDLLSTLYWTDNKSLKEVGFEINLSVGQVRRFLRKYGIPSRPFSTKGRTSWNKGKTLSDATKAKLSKAHMGKKLNPEHREKIIKSLAIGRGAENGNWKGGRYINRAGYVYLKSPQHPNKLSNGYVAEHRLVVESKVGRYLNRYEHVHHLNGIKGDNRPENLELLNGQTHGLVTRMEQRIKELEAEVERLKTVKNLIDA